MALLAGIYVRLAAFASGMLLVIFAASAFLLAAYRPAAKSSPAALP